jgi:hypothetical protein
LGEARALLTSYAQSPQGWVKKGLEVRQDGVVRCAFELFSISGISVGRLEGFGEGVLERVEIEGAFVFFWLGYSWIGR